MASIYLERNAGCIGKRFVNVPRYAGDLFPVKHCQTFGATLISHIALQCYEFQNCMICFDSRFTTRTLLEYRQRFLSRTISSDTKLKFCTPFLWVKFVCQFLL